MTKTAVIPAAIADIGVQDIVELLASRTTILVVTALEAGATRFGMLQSATGINPQLLSKTLRRLESAGLICREAYAEIPPRVEYELSALGETLCPIVQSINQWARDHLDEVSRANAKA